ncbi:hypothetical protein PAJ_0804 [Pantoea ananatis AJ13355]|uniref:Uncharacterized protein n=1 Tax=Pantoea ananatis (strain AJ13355) TaxID=932677 RepID=A0A0H3KUD9_PANAA|nr:hypothetical protein PAJ_0804 [Pantoea ananatis AJ13355]
MTSAECYKALFPFGIAPHRFDHALRQQGLLATGLRLCLIFDTLDKMLCGPDESALGQMALPGGRRRDHHPRPSLHLPVAHVMNINALAIAYGADAFALASCPTMHAGRDLQLSGIEMVLRIQHLSLLIGQDVPLTRKRTSPGQPQGGVDNMEIIIQ